MATPLSRRETVYLLMIALAILISFVVVWLASEPPRAHAQDQTDLELAQVAFEAGVDPVALAGASNSTGLAPRQYLLSVGELKVPEPSLERLLDCLAWFESHNTPTAVNRATGAAGLYQYLLSTWLSTPQGRAGLSRLDPLAARQATIWMIHQGRLREWSVWRRCA
jgi:hypothetical protein